MDLIFATSNQNKAREIAAILPSAYTVKTLKEIGFTGDIPETSETIEGNALLKARIVYEKFGKNCFADDSGLEVEALDGAPGVYSARYAGESGNDKANIKKLLRELKNKPNRRARFKTVIAIILDGKEHLFEGVVNGGITETEKGEKGFGYDPVFKPEGYEITFAEMAPAEKNRISHRAIALGKMVGFLRGNEWK